MHDAYFFDGNGSGVLSNFWCLLLSAPCPFLGSASTGIISCFFTGTVGCLLESFATGPLLGSTGALSCFFTVTVGCLSGGVSFSRGLASGNLPAYGHDYYWFLSTMQNARICHLHCDTYQNTPSLFLPSFLLYIASYWKPGNWTLGPRL